MPHTPTYARLEPFDRTAAVLSAAPEQDNQRVASPGHRPRPLRDPHAVAARLAGWSEAARSAGRTRRADRLLLLAWEAYDRPARGSWPRRADAGLLAA